MVAFLLRKKADVEAKDKYEVTALHIAAQYGETQCLRLLILAGTRLFPLSHDVQLYKEQTNAVLKYESNLISSQVLM